MSEVTTNGRKLSVAPEIRTTDGTPIVIQQLAGGLRLQIGEQVGPFLDVENAAKLSVALRRELERRVRAFGSPA